MLNWRLNALLSKQNFMNYTEKLRKLLNKRKMKEK